ncbi:phosphoinositide phospholipase C 6-like isoform X3 [Wolffia australiana]
MMGSYRLCLCFTRRFQWKEVQPPRDVKEAFALYAQGHPYMNAEQLRRFLVDIQGESATTVADAQAVIDHFLHMSRRYVVRLSGSFLSLEDFQRFLFSEEFNPPVLSKVHQDMTAPLSQYFVYTGHNSYLTGNQLSSNSSDVPIKKALHKGVKVIELDIWPNSAKDDVHVYHGGTLTSPVELIKCLRTIRDYAFASSTYPVVITLEDHLSPNLQDKVAKMVIQTFGDVIYYPKSECLSEFPSPEALRNRVILSTKAPGEYRKSRTSRNREENESEGILAGKEKEYNHESENDGEYISDDDEEDEDDDDYDDCNYCAGGKKDNSSPQTVAPEYRRLITVTAGKPKGGLRKALKLDVNWVRRLSLSEQELERAARFYGKDIVRFTQKNLLRIYPKGTRFNSSNYNPMIGWMHGAQMVAFNMQGYGRYLWLMQGFFRANGGCGFVKKPDFLLNLGPNDEVFDPQTKVPVRKILKVKVYMSDGWRLDFKPTHFDSYSPPDFYAKVGIAGVPADSQMKRTKAIEDQWAPVWEEEFIFPLTMPELALLRVEVHEYDISDKDDFGGQTCLPVTELRPGIRAVPLFDQKGIKFPSVRLLMRFQFI